MVSLIKGRPGTWQHPAECHYHIRVEVSDLLYSVGHALKELATNVTEVCSSSCVRTLQHLSSVTYGAAVFL